MQWFHKNAKGPKKRIFQYEYFYIVRFLLLKSGRWTKFPVSDLGAKEETFIPTSR